MSEMNAFTLYELLGKSAQSHLKTHKKTEEKINIVDSLSSDLKREIKEFWVNKDGWEAFPHVERSDKFKCTYIYALEDENIFPGTKSTTLSIPFLNHRYQKGEQKWNGLT